MSVTSVVDATLSRVQNYFTEPINRGESFSLVTSRLIERATDNFAQTHSSFYTTEMESEADMLRRPEPTTRIIFGNSRNFTRIRNGSGFQNYDDGPLLVEAWAQTVQDDFGLLDDMQRQRNIELQKEVNALREKVRLLEEDLDIHQKLLNQIHATAALKTYSSDRRVDTEYIAHTPTPTPPVTPILNQHNINSHQASRRISPTTTTSVGESIVTPAQTVPQAFGAQITAHMKIEAPNVMSTMDSNSVKYTIVASEVNENNNCEPIEIQLAEEDGAINLNNSADSGRLEICLSTEEQTEKNQKNEHNWNEHKVQIVKEECKLENSQPLQQMPAQSGILVKRRKIINEGNVAHDNQYYYNGHSCEPSSTASVICHSISNELPTSTSHNINSRPSSRASSERTISNQMQSMASQTTSNIIRHHNDDNVMVSIGPNNTRVPYKLYESINWDSPSIATRKLLMAVFDRQTLATHSMTGKPSPAFKGQAKPQKKRLDPSVTEDIIFVVTRRCKVSDKEVRNAITTKCADENKMMKLQMKKSRSLYESNKENYTA